MLAAASLSPTEICLSIRSLFAPFLRGEHRRGEGARQPGESGIVAFRLYEHACADRPAVEDFISRRFAESFGSRVEAFMPRLFSVRDDKDRICGAFGLRSARRRLFLEQYLDQPIEAAVAERTGRAADRGGIVEIGHFSGNFPGAMRTMIRLLTERLHYEGFDWVVFTGTTELRNAFARLGLPLIDIEAAERDRLPPEERKAWGSYYEHSPRVVVGDIRLGFEALVRSAAPLTKREAA